MSFSGELRKLRSLKTKAETIGRQKKKADEAFKKQQARALDRFEAVELESARTYGYQFTPVPKVKGFVDDRAKYVRWCLENDPVVIEFLEYYEAVLADQGIDTETIEERVEEFYAVLTSTSQVHYKEDGNVMNQQARAHVDDGAPLPPGLNFRPDPYISMTKS